MAAMETTTTMTTTTPYRCHLWVDAGRDNDDDTEIKPDALSLIKAAVASSVFGVPLERAPASTCAAPACPAAVCKPALFATHACAGVEHGVEAIAFGGNGVVRALGNLRAAGAAAAVVGAPGDEMSRLAEKDPATSASIDDWLEYERSTLRPALRGYRSSPGAAAAKKKAEAALAKLEAALSSGGGGGGEARLHLVDRKGAAVGPTAADIAVVVTLTSLLGPATPTKTTTTKTTTTTTTTTPATAMADLLESFPSVASYASTHHDSEAFVRGRDVLLPQLLAPPSAPFDASCASASLGCDSDPSLLRAVESVFARAIASAFPPPSDAGKGNQNNDKHDWSALPVNVAKCNQLKFGDYQCNASMSLFQKLKNSNNLPPTISSPQDVARAIISTIPTTNHILDSLQVNGPGFILCRIKSSFLQQRTDALLKNGTPTKPRCGPDTKTKLEKCVVDFSSPNIAKEMHVGHLRSTIIGEAVCRVLEFVGCDVMRVNHVGDWGTQFGMLIQYLKEEYPNFCSGGSDGGADSSIGDLTVFYKNAKKRFDEDEEFKEASRTNVVKLQSGDSECRAIWQILCDVSRKEFVKVYDRLDITLEEFGESFYNDKIPPVIREFEDKGMIEVQEGGAKCVFVPKFRVPLMMQKSDGGYGYDSTDMAALKYRLYDLAATRLVYITDFGQGDHFKLCFAAAERIGWVDPAKHRLLHIGFGTVMGEDGKRFKTRSGDTVRLVDLLDEAVGRMESSLRERIADGSANITEDEVHETACAMGYGAVKYFDLRRNPTTNYKFSYDQMLDTKGNTAIYLLYAHARLESICSKGKSLHGTDVDELIASGRTEVAIAHPSERNLAMHLHMFSDVIEETLDDLFPYHICDYLYSVSIAVSDFVTQCRVLGSPEMQSRLLLCRATAIVMRQCFDLLAIRHVMRI